MATENKQKANKLGSCFGSLVINLWMENPYFKEHFSNETYSDGPFLGLEEMRAQKKEKLQAACSNKDITVH
ncbi:MAG: hypothetical protein JRF62_16190 [Deltaproteobacteria bacterium]|nr:hypothetical protein [Deltaproteobacteria bacterium]MBW2641552.1 hypothetical protein [Deltaproteobacteria bacterium]